MVNTSKWLSPEATCLPTTPLAKRGVMATSGCLTADPTPSCPISLLPHTITWPDDSTAAEWAKPAAKLLIVPIASRTSHTAPGHESVWYPVDRPSWPNLFQPQEKATPSAVRARQ